MSDLPNLPLELCREILLRSPAESVFRFRAVCKAWRKIIDDRSFARAHTLDHLSSSHTLILRNTLGPPFEPLHTFDIASLHIPTGGHQSVSASSHRLECDEAHSLLGCLPVPECHGLILLHPEYIDENPLEIWNLSTHERLRLPRGDYRRSSPLFFGLGYDHAAQDFKAVAIDRQQTHVYSLLSGKWRTIGVCKLRSVDGWWPQEYPGVFVHGALHWLLGDDCTIVAMDLATEKHRHIRLNALPTKGYAKIIHVLGGCLAVSGFSISRFYVWVMKDYGSDDESWAKLLSIKRADLVPFGLDDLRPVAYIKDKKQVFLEECHGSGFFVFDLESDSMKTVRIKGLTGDSYAQVIPRSMFRLRDNCRLRKGSRLLSLDPPQKRKLSFAITTYPAPLKKHKKNKKLAS